MGRKVKVVHLIDSLGPGGAQVVVRNLVKYRDAARFHVEVWSLHGPGVYAGEIESLGVRTRALCASRRDVRLPFRVVSEVRRAEPDVLHAHLVVSCLLAERLAWAMPPMAVVCHVHNRFRCHDDGYQNWLEPRLYSRCNAVVSCGPAVTKSLTHQGGLSRRRIATIQNGVDDELFTGRLPEVGKEVRVEMGTPMAAPVFLSAARLTPEKNLLHALAVFARLRGRFENAEYWIAGAGPSENDLKNAARGMGCADGVRFLGFRSDVSRLLQGADMLLMPSKYEGLSMTLIEAMAAGAVPVVTPFDGAEEMVALGRAGIVIPFDDTEAGAAEIGKVMADAAVMESLRREAIRRAGHWRASRMTRRVEQLYERLEA